MNPERYQQVKQIFEAVIACDTGERPDFLARACAGDQELRTEVESLLEHDKPAAEFIEESAFEVTARLLADNEAESIREQRLGSYKILGEIGRGGMGVVYLAARDDEQFTKRVAIKLIKRGMDTDAVLRRFRNERQILAQLEHPNIARLLDGGTTEDGLPYFVMEYVEGTPVIRYCDDHKLSTDERLKLFRQICAAIQYAHQNLVIHRDIKPVNILVTDKGEPKLLDFGIAKLLHSDTSQPQTEMTATALRVMTPEYASPEQIRAEKITTATDVYSLGVVLYELLTGHRPHLLKSHRPDEIARAICDVEPERPSTAISRVEELPSSDGTAPVSITPESVSATREGQPEKLRHRLTGDLDNIVLMALRKEPQRRYESAAQLSADIQRHLDGLPVIARKDTFAYRASKFVGRNKVGVVAVALVVLTLIGGIVATAWQARRAETQRAKAEKRFNDMHRLANSFMFEVYPKIQELQGATEARETLVKRALEYLDSLAQEAGGDRSLQYELAVAYWTVGDSQGKPYVPNLGDTAGAIASYRKAQAIFESLLAAEPRNSDVPYRLGSVYQHLANVLDVTGDPNEAIATQRKAVSMFEASVAAAPNNAQYRLALASGYNYLAGVLWNEAHNNQSVEPARQALERNRQAIAIVEA
jgi:eukaryotic-like serine/threonine-protein kinase